MIEPVVGLTLNFRDVPRTLKCVSSLLAEGVQSVWVCDNSEDGGRSAEALREAFAEDPRVVVKENPINLGFAAAINDALSCIRQQYPSVFVLIINNDARLLKGALEPLREAMDRRREAILAYPLVRQGGVTHGPRYYHRWLGLVTDFTLPGSFPYPSGCVLMVSLDRICLPLFEEDFFMYGEDVLLGWRFRDNRKMVFVPSLCAEHEGSASSRLGSMFYETRVVAGHWILARKLSGSPAQRMAMYGGRLFALSIRATLRALRFRSVLPLRAFWNGWQLAFVSDPMRERCCRSFAGK